MAFPNPFNDQVLVDTSGLHGEYRWWVHDAAGRTVQQGAGNADRRASFGISGLSKGLYSLTCVDAWEARTIKMVCQ